MTGCVYTWISVPALGGVDDYAAKESMIMPLTLSVYYVIRYISVKRKRPNKALCRFIVWCGGNVFGIYLLEDYLRNGTAVIWERLVPYISAVPACAVWLLAVFLLGNVLIAVWRRIPFLRKVL